MVLTSAPLPACAPAVHSKSAESAAKLIISIYELLTGRKITGSAFTSLDGDPAGDPAFARPNATSLIASNIRESEMTTTLLDQSAAASRAKSLIDDHADAQRGAREADPGRFAMPPGATASAMSMQRMLRGEPKPMPQEIEAAQVRFQEVRVTAVERNIAQLRASRDANLQGGQSYVSSASAPAAVPMALIGRPPQPPPGKGTVDINGLLSATLYPEVASHVGAPGSVDFAAMLDNLLALPVDVVQALFEAASHGALGPMAEACKAEPSNGWQVFSLLTPALAAADASGPFGVVCDFLVAFATQLADCPAGMEVLVSYALPFLLPLLRAARVQIAPHVLRIAYAFVPPEPSAHIEVIRELQDKLDDQSTFVMLMPHLVALEAEFSDDLFNLYIYYAVLALDLTDPKLRASAIGVLVVLSDAQLKPDVFFDLVPKLTELKDEWWEALAQMARLGRSLLALTPPAALSEARAGAATGLLRKALASRCPSAQAIALSCAAPLLSDHPSLLRQAFTESLLDLPASMRAALLSEDAPPISIATAGGGGLAAATLPSLWSPLHVASALMDTARARKLDTLEPSYGEVLTALLPSGATPNHLFAHSEAGRAAWTEWLKLNKDYLYVSLCDDELCVSATVALASLFTILKEDVLPTFSTLLSSLRMLCDSAEAGGLCHRTATGFLLDLYHSGPPFSDAIKNLVANFDAPMREVLDQLVSGVESA